MGKKQTRYAIVLTAVSCQSVMETAVLTYTTSRITRNLITPGAYPYIHGITCTLKRKRKEKKQQEEIHDQRTGRREKGKHKKKKRTPTCAQGAGRVPRTRLLFAGTIKSYDRYVQLTSLRTDVTRKPDGRQADKKRVETKSKQQAKNELCPGGGSRTTRPTQRGQKQTGRGGAKRKKKQNRKKETENSQKGHTNITIR